MSVQAGALWARIQAELEESLAPKDFITWIKPLQAAIGNEGEFRLYAPNRFFVERLREAYRTRIIELLERHSEGQFRELILEVGSVTPSPRVRIESPARLSTPTRSDAVELQPGHFDSHLDEQYTFDNFVQGQSNQLAYAACMQVAEQSGGKTHNPLFIYGPTALGKSHLMHALGNRIRLRMPGAKVLYCRSETFVADYVASLRHKVEDFSRRYRSVDVLLIDDIHFFAGKTQTQVEFFHTFNELLAGSKQIVLASDRYPKELDQLDDRLKSRFSWGLTVQIEAPELETRVAILMKKAEFLGIDLPRDVAFFIAQQVQTNVRELEGALNKVFAMARFRGSSCIDMGLTRESLRDIVAVNAKLVGIDNIQKVVAEFYHIPLRELTGKKRTRSFARPRQIAMALARELTDLSLPEIGDAFDGRDHTTVLHACKTVVEKRREDPRLEEDYSCLLRSLQT